MVQVAENFLVVKVQAIDSRQTFEDNETVHSGCHVGAWAPLLVTLPVTTHGAAHWQQPMFRRVGEETLVEQGYRGKQILVSICIGAVRFWCSWRQMGSSCLGKARIDNDPFACAEQIALNGRGVRGGPGSDLRMVLDASSP
jgi:hypothetical protein